MVQPQAQANSTLQWEMTGEELGQQGSLGTNSQTSLRVPPDIASNEAVHRLLGDNQQLREALRRSNEALRERCEEMVGWQRRSKEEREFLGCRFREARALVERLSNENRSLLGQLSNTSPESNSSVEAGCQSNDQNHDQDRDQARKQNGPELERNGLTEFPQMSKERLKMDQVKVEETKRQTMPQSLPAEGANEFLQLLKSHKEKLEEGMKELRRKNETLERENQESKKEREGLHRVIEQLQRQLAHTQGSGVVEDVVQRAEAPSSSDSSHLARVTEQLQAAQGRYNELQDKLDSLEKNTAQRNRTEALLKQKEKECTQLAKDGEALKAQVTSLLGELHERQSCLEKSEQERKQLDEKLCSKLETLQCLEREMEQQKKQHSVTIDKLLLQTQNLETALKTDRLVITEERRKLAQLQYAYTCLFQDHNSKLKTENQDDRLEEAERALAMKQSLIDKLKEEVEQLKSSLETVPVLTAQAEIYKADFLAEREAREKLHQKKEELQEQLSQALSEIDRLKQEGTSRARMEEMQQRHLEDFRAVRQTNPPPGAFPGVTVFNPAPPATFHSMGEELPDFRCPKCQYQAPDMDTLQIHVMDCIQ